MGAKDIKEKQQSLQGAGTQPHWNSQDSCDRQLKAEFAATNPASKKPDSACYLLRTLDAHGPHDKLHGLSKKTVLSL